MSQFDQFANQGGAAAEGPEEMAEAKRVAEEHLKNADYDGHVPEPLGKQAADSPPDTAGGDRSGDTDVDESENRDDAGSDTTADR